MVVVTGASGHIGNVLVKELILKGISVRAVVLPKEDIASIENLGIEIVEGDVRNIESLINAFNGAEYVYHLAGIVSIGSGRKKLIYDVNVNGTKNVIEASKLCKIKRLVYVSSIHAFEIPPHGTSITEIKEFSPLKVPGIYAKTKAEATREVLRAANMGVDTVIVHPTGVIGPFEYKLSNMGQLINDYISGKLFAYIDGAYDFVDVRDVAKGIILAGEKGRKGENYILSGEQITVRELMNILQEETGISAPRIKIPVWLAKITGPFSELYYFLKKQQPIFTTYSITTLCSNSLTNHNKARLELGYSPMPVKESLRDYIRWIRENKNMFKAV